nr:hypothetical protein [Tanacetum cinerariifolium]
MKLATKRSLIQTHSSHASDSGADEGTGCKPRVPNVLTYGSDDEQISWKSSEDEDDDEEYDGQDDESQDDDNEQTDSDNDGDDFVHPKFSTHDQDERQDEEDSFDPRGRERQLECRDIEMTDAQQINVQTTQVIEDTHVIITPVNPEGQQQSSSVSSGFISNMLKPSLNTGIDSIFNLNRYSTSLVDVLVTTIAEPPLLFATTLPLPPTPLITHLQQTPVLTPATVPSSSLQDLPYKNLYKSLVDAYESDKLILDTYGDTVTFKRRRDDEDKDEEPFAGSNRGSKRRRAGKELESTSTPKEKTFKTTGKSTEGPGSKRRREGKEHESATAPTETATRSAGRSTQGSQSRQASASMSAFIEEPMQTTCQMEEPSHSEFDTGVEDQPITSYVVAVDLSKMELKKIIIEKMEALVFVTEVVYFRLETPPLRYVSKTSFSDRDWNKTLPDAHGPVQPWLSSLAQMENPNKKNRLMHIDELHKFSDGTLNDVRTALDDCLNGIRMKNLPQTIWRQSDRDKAGSMIQVIDKQLKTKRIMRSLEKFIGGRPYEGDFRLQQRTI